MKKTIYLRDSKNEWQEYEYEKISEIKELLDERNILICEKSLVNNSFIGEGSTVEGSTVEGSRVEGSRVEGSTVNGSTVNGSRVLNGQINCGMAIFAANIYKYAMSAYFDKQGGQMIQLGCYTRTRQEWEADFWNNPNEFPNDGSEASNARLRAFKIACLFFDDLKTNS